MSSDLLLWTRREVVHGKARLPFVLGLVSILLTALSTWNDAPTWLTRLIADQPRAAASTATLLFLLVFVMRAGKSTCRVPITASLRTTRTHAATRQFLRAWTRLWWTFAGMYLYATARGWGILDDSLASRAVELVANWLPQWFMVECYAVLRWETVDRAGSPPWDPLVIWRVVLVSLALIEFALLFYPEAPVCCACAPSVDALSVLTGTLTICLFTGRISTFAFGLPEWVPVLLYLYAGSQLLAGANASIQSSEVLMAIVIAYGTLAKFVLFLAGQYAIERGHLAYYLASISKTVERLARTREATLASYGPLPKAG